jgi:Rod binding domain-containing protein
VDLIDMPSLQARQLYERTRVQRDLAAARERARAAGSDGITAQIVRRSDIDRQSKLYKAAQDFEAIFVKQMLNSMRKTVDKSGFVDGGMAEEIFEDMLYDEYAAKMTRVAGFGLADQIYLQLARDSAPGK